MHEGPFEGLVLRFTIHWNNYSNQSDSLFSFNSSSSCLDLSTQLNSSIQKHNIQLPTIKINSQMTTLFVHPLVKNLNQLDIQFFIAQRLMLLEEGENISATELPPSKVVSAALVLEFISQSFSQSGLDKIASCGSTSELAQYISNIDAWKILTTDRQTFGKLAQEIVRSTQDEQALYASIEGCPFQFKSDN